MDYSGHVPDEYYQKPVLRALPKPRDSTFDINKEAIPSGSSPIKELLNRMVEDTEETRQKILFYLIENPGMIATFENDFHVELAPLEIRTLDSSDIDPLNEVRLEIIQRWRIRQRRDDDDDSASLGGDSGGEARAD